MSSLWLPRVYAFLMTFALTFVAVYKPDRSPELTTPLLLTIRQSVGMAPLTLRVKVKAATAGQEVCVVVDGPEAFRSCRTLDNVTWTLDFTLRAGGDYTVWAESGQDRTAEVPIKVIGTEDTP